MRIAYSDEQEALRRELQAYFGKLMTDEVRHELTSGDGEYGGSDLYPDLVRRMGADGWLGIGWPKEFGGQDRSLLDQLIFTDEALRCGAPVPFLMVNSIAPTIMEHGTDAQRSFFLPKILAGEIHFSIGYSEPDAGTDLASLRTRAVRDGDEWVIDGQKMWTSLIRWADYVWLAARTDPDLPRHKGLSLFAVPTSAPGFSWSPVTTITGATTSQTFYDGVRVGTDALIGDQNGGWRLITGQLNRERVALCSSAALQQALVEVVAWARETTLADGRRVIDQEWVRVNLGRVHARVEFLKLVNWKVAWGLDRGVSPADASATKVFGTELNTEAYRLLMECLGPQSVVAGTSRASVLRGRIERAQRSALILTFGGGTNEIQRDIISMVALGLPRAPR